MMDNHQFETIWHAIQRLENRVSELSRETSGRFYELEREVSWLKIEIANLAATIGSQRK